VFATFLKTQWRVEDISGALLGYFPALFGAAVLEFTAKTQPYLRYFSFIALLIFFPTAVMVAKTEHFWQLSLALPAHA
jgi:hypothetical protein